MNSKAVKAGTLVYSLAGHDKGWWYIVLRSEDDFVHVADGKHHGLENPKKKRLKHVAFPQGETEIGLSDEELAGIECDAHVRKAIKRLKTEGGCHLG